MNDIRVDYPYGWSTLIEFHINLGCLHSAGR